jgi:hypothetical protein
VNSNSAILGVIAIAIGFVVVFLLTREFWCWYWKINRLVSLLEEQNSLQRSLMRSQGVEPAPPPQVATATRSMDGDPSLGPMVCPQCSAEYQPGYATCSDCGVDLVPVR